MWCYDHKVPTSFLGTFIGMIVRIVSAGKTERTKIENPEPDKPSMMTVSSVLQFTKDVTGTIVNEIMTMVLGAPVVKTAVEKLNPSDTLPITTSEIDKLKAELFALQNDVVLWLPMFNKNLEGFREEIEKLVESGQCSPELRDKCIEHFLEIKKVLNGNIGDL